MGNKVIAETVLQMTQGTSNKQYTARLLEDDDGHIMLEAEWGKINGPQTTQTKLFGTETFTTSLSVAQEAKRTLVGQKQAKGYVIVS